MYFTPLNGLKLLFILGQFRLIYNSYLNFIWSFTSKNDIRIRGTNFFMCVNIIKCIVLVKDAE